jgi:hypothetical protein
VRHVVLVTTRESWRRAKSGRTIQSLLTRAMRGIRMMQQERREEQRVTMWKQSLEACAIGDTYITLCQQARTELHVIVQVERPCSLELLAEGCDGSYVGQLLHTPYSSELLMGVLGGRETRSPTRATGMMTMRRRRAGRRRVLMSIVVVVRRHYLLIEGATDGLEERW